MNGKKLAGILLAVSMIAGGSPLSAETVEYSYEFENNVFAAGETVELNGIEWTLASGTSDDYADPLYPDLKGMEAGNGVRMISTFFKGKDVYSVEIRAWSTTGSMALTDGTSQPFISDDSGTSVSTLYEYNELYSGMSYVYTPAKKAEFHTVKDNLNLYFAGPKKGILLKSIAVTYEDTGSDVPVGMTSLPPERNEVNAVLYTLDGRQVGSGDPQPGIYVERRGSSVRKIVVR